MAYDHYLADRVRSILERRSGFSEQKMFGGIAFMMNGHMCCGIMKNDLMVRLPAEAVVSGLERPHTRRMDFTGKPMKSMILVDPAGCDSEEALQEWVESGLRFVLTLPPKQRAVRA